VGNCAAGNLLMYWKSWSHSGKLQSHRTLTGDSRGAMFSSTYMGCKAEACMWDEAVSLDATTQLPLTSAEGSAENLCDAGLDNQNPWSPLPSR